MFDLTTYLPYLVNRTGVRLAAAFSEAIRPHGVTLQMWRVLAALHHENGLRIGALADVTSMDVSTLSRLIGTMERKALVERRRRSGGDARVVTVHATAHGEGMTNAIVPLAQRYEALALREFTPDEAAALKALLVRVYGNIDAIDRLPASDAA